MIAAQLMGSPDPTAGPTAVAAADGESIILLAPFANYTAGQQGYNIRGRIKEEIDREISTAGLTGVRTVEWPNEIEGEPAAIAAGRMANATIVIWGEYDSGRVIAALTIPSRLLGRPRIPARPAGGQFGVLARGAVNYN